MWNYNFVNLIYHDFHLRHLQDAAGILQDVDSGNHIPHDQVSFARADQLLRLVHYIRTVGRDTSKKPNQITYRNGC